MFNDKTFLVVIPARGGSKGLPGKNIKSLCGKPLIAWTIEAGLGSKYIDELLVTTDYKDIAEISKSYGANVPFIRPKELASDTASTYDAVKHAIDFLSLNYNKKFDYLILLEPTSPLREEDDIDLMIEKLVSFESDFDAIVSLGEVHDHPTIMKKVNGFQINPYIDGVSSASRRQDNDKAYFPYGVAYIVKTETFFNEKTFYPRRTTYHFIKRYQCYEIDDICDFLAIENILNNKSGAV